MGDYITSVGSEAKYKANALMLPHLGLQGMTCASVLSLPAENWNWEMMVAAAYPEIRFTFYGAELNPVRHRAALDKAARLNAKTNNINCILLPCADLTDLLAEGGHIPDHSVDLAYLDWMGTWGTSKRQQIMMVCARYLKPDNAKIMTTLSNCRGIGPELELVKSMTSRVWPGARLKDIRTCAKYYKPVELVSHYSLAGVSTRIANIARTAGRLRADRVMAVGYRGGDDNTNHGNTEVCMLLNTKRI